MRSVWFHGSRMAALYNQLNAQGSKSLSLSSGLKSSPLSNSSTSSSLSSSSSSLNRYLIALAAARRPRAARGATGESDVRSMSSLSSSSDTTAGFFLAAVFFAGAFLAAGAFLGAAAFFAGAFFAGAFFAGAFLVAAFFAAGLDFLTTGEGSSNANAASSSMLSLSSDRKSLYTFGFSVVCLALRLDPLVALGASSSSSSALLIKGSVRASFCSVLLVVVLTDVVMRARRSARLSGSGSSSSDSGVRSMALTALLRFAGLAGLTLVASFSGLRACLEPARDSGAGVSWSTGAVTAVFFLAAAAATVVCLAVAEAFLLRDFEVLGWYSSSSSSSK
eukprot:m.223371 g.223371  ORF g.223371 m.223371 type:complete len:334 (-) comp18752_c0_seq2:3687-4688(-)